MGFNISGIAINKNYENEFDQLQKELGWNLEKQSEIDFETAASNYKEKGIHDVFFSDKGTIIFMDINDPLTPPLLKNDNTLTFGIYEGSMTFFLHYYENSTCKRSIIEIDGMRDEEEDFGDALEVEKKHYRYISNHL